MSNIRDVTHIDGTWKTSDHSYKGYNLTIKMRSSKGCKIHIWNKESTKVIKTFRYNFATDKVLLDKAYEYIDDKLEVEELAEKAKFFNIFELTGTYPM